MAIQNFFDEIDSFNEEEEKKQFIQHLTDLKSLSVEEIVLRQKYAELQEFKWAYNKSTLLKSMIWRPTDISNKEQTLTELAALRPKLTYIERSDAERWLLYRIFVHSMNFDQNPGRFLRFILEDEGTGKVLGVASLGSDVINVSCRDSWIGWSEDIKLAGKLNNTAIATTIVPTQPLGYNFLGGKLLASMLVSGCAEQRWKQEYDNTLIGITTTSLYGNGSMYNSIPWWKSLGETTGAMAVKPEDKYYRVWHQIIKKKYPDEYNEKAIPAAGGPPPTAVKQKILTMIFKELGIKPSHFAHGFKRGVYFAPLYDNVKEFLCGTISESALRPIKRGRSDADIISWWKAKAAARYVTLHEQNRLKPEILYYNDLMFMTWDEAKTKYLGEIGR